MPKGKGRGKHAHCPVSGNLGLPGLFVVLRESRWLDDKKSSASDVGDASQVSCLGYLGDPKCSTVRPPKVFLVSSSFFLRMKLLKFKPQRISVDRVKSRVVKGVSMVAVQPSDVMRASDVQMPSQRDRNRRQKDQNRFLALPRSSRRLVSQEG